MTCRIRPAAEILSAFVDSVRRGQTEAGYLNIDGHTTDAELRSTARGLTLDAKDAGHLVTVPEALAYVTAVRAACRAQVPVCPHCGKLCPEALEDGAVDGPRDWHADCWLSLSDAEQEQVWTQRRDAGIEED